MINLSDVGGYTLIMQRYGTKCW